MEGRKIREEWKEEMKKGMQRLQKQGEKGRI